MRSRYIKEAFIAIVLLVFTTEISAQNFKHIKVTEENHISEIKSLYIKTAFLDGLPNIKDEAYGYIVKDNDGYGYLLINQKNCESALLSLQIKIHTLMTNLMSLVI